MVIDEGAEEEVEDKIVAHVEVGFNITHVVQCFNEIELSELDQFKSY